MNFSPALQDIEYYGLKLTVPYLFKFIATNKTGEVLLYRHTPNPNCVTGRFESLIRKEEPLLIGYFTNLNFDWMKSDKFIDDILIKRHEDLIID